LNAWLLDALMVASVSSAFFDVIAIHEGEDVRQLPLLMEKVHLYRPLVVERAASSWQHKLRLARHFSSQLERHPA
jgi:hypothetical protein